MTKQKRMKECQAILHAGIKNLFQSQSALGMEHFSISVLEILMLLEREEYLKGAEGKGDIGNGTYQRSFRTLQPNSLLISIPRTRNGLFKPLTLELLTRQQEQINQFALLLYRKGMSSRDVSSIMKEFFGEQMSYETINNLAESFHEIREKWEKTPLDPYYKVIYCDTLYVSVKRNNSYSKEALHVIYGIKEDNTRELLLLAVNPTESHNVWGEYYERLRKRGVCSVDLIVADGLKGLSDTAKRYFPGSRFQRCVAHKMRCILYKVRPRDKAVVARDLKEVFNNFDARATVVEAQAKLSAFCTRWQEAYPNVVASLSTEEMEDYFTYVSCPVETRRMVYTTNSIENLNRQIRKVTKTKVTFDKVENLLDLVFMVIRDFEGNNWQRYPVQNFTYWTRKTQPV